MIESNSLTIEWNRIYLRNVGRPILLSLILVPLISLLSVEIYTNINIKKSAEAIAPELAQSIITGDSYLARRSLNILSSSLQLSFIELKNETGLFAQTGKKEDGILSLFLLKTTIPIKTNWGTTVGSLTIIGNFLSVQRTLSLIFFCFSLIIFMILRVSINLFYKIIQFHIEEIDEITSMISESSTNKMSEFIIKEKFKNETAKRLVEVFKKFILLTEEAYSQKIQLEKTEAVNMMAAQVAHDIRSPLTALNLIIESTNDIEEDKRIMVRKAVQRINDIANCLLIRESKKGDIAFESSIKAELIPLLIDSIVSEKRVQFRNNENIIIETNLSKSYGLYATVDSIELKRVISNLINNSVEACINRALIEVHVIEKNINELIIKIKDNGKGMSLDLINKIGSRGLTEGKQNSLSSGSGLGLFHAKSTIEKFGGNLEVISKMGYGTEILLSLPRAESPTWTLEELIIYYNCDILVLDDDLSIHSLWRSRFKDITQDSLSIHTFLTGDLFKKYIYSFSIEKEAVALVDYELLNQKENGLDIIKELKIQYPNINFILVTSRSDELNLQIRVHELSCKMIPKEMVNILPISFLPLERKYNNESNKIKSNHNICTRMNKVDKNIDLNQVKLKYDLCLLDDDHEIIHVMWNSIAKSKGLKIRTFATPRDFFIEVDSIDRNTPVYVDVSLGNGINGVDIAKEIFKLGFFEINLATGYDPELIEVPQFITRVVGKDFPLITD